MKSLNSSRVPVIDRIAAGILLVWSLPTILVVVFLIHFTARVQAFVTEEARTVDGGLANRFRFRTSVSGSNEAFRIVGGFLRKYGVDELPGLWNVIRGELTLKDLRHVR